MRSTHASLAAGFALATAGALDAFPAESQTKQAIEKCYGVSLAGQNKVGPGMSCAGTFVLNYHDNTEKFAKSARGRIRR